MVYGASSRAIRQAQDDSPSTLNTESTSLQTLFSPLKTCAKEGRHAREEDASFLSMTMVNNLYHIINFLLY